MKRNFEKKPKLLKVLIHGNSLYSLLHSQQSPEGSEGKEAPKVTKQEVNDLSVYCVCVCVCAVLSVCCVLSACECVRD